MNRVEEARAARDVHPIEIAQAIREGFDKHYGLFRQTSAAGKQRFEAADWHAVQDAQRERIKFYDRRVDETYRLLEESFSASKLGDQTWRDIKLNYIGLLTDHKQPELAETFFNSVSCKILHRSYYKNEFIFVRPAVSDEHIDSNPPSYRCYYPLNGGLRKCIAEILRDLDLKRPFDNLERDLRCVLRVIRAQLGRPLVAEANCQIQVLSSLFYRNKGAYLVGKLVNGPRHYPFVIPILYAPNGQLLLDAMLLDLEHLSVLFSSSRAYFMVDMEVPSAFVQFLSAMLPGKPKAELYTILGLQKHGKTLFYRDFLHHLRHSRDDFMIAPGIKGLVMLVFTLPSFPWVFKVIKDEIAPPKEVNRDIVKQKYLMVKYHDRVGRDRKSVV